MTTRLLALLAGLLAFGPSSSASAHSLRFGVLRLTPSEGGVSLQLRASGSEGQPPGLSLRGSEGCAITVVERRVDGDRLYVDAQLSCPGVAAPAIEVSGLVASGVTLAVERLGRTGARQVELLAPGTSLVPLDERRPALVSGGWRRYVELGLRHILGGLDHLAFVLLLCLVVRDRRGPRGARTLLLALTGFTFGHSLTLGLASLDLIRLPAAPVEACIALSIVFLAADLLRPVSAGVGASFRHPASVAAFFGLLHGLGFAGALTVSGLAPSDALVGLAAFNLGVELGQLLFVGLCAALAHTLSRVRVALPIRAIAGAVGVVATVWTVARLTALA